MVLLKNNSALWLAMLITQACTVHAAPLKTETNSRAFSVSLGATRVVYPENSSGAQLSVGNMQNYPILVQSTVTGEDHQSPAPFLVTPPLFRLEANQQSRLRVIRTGGGLPAEKESMFWLCVKAMPPVEDNLDKEADKVSLAINLAISTCDKLLYRPSSLKADPETVAGSLEWSRKGGKLHVSNKTPYYMSFKSVRVGATALSGLSYVKPKGEASLDLPANATGDVIWTVINDQGGESKQFQASLK